MENLENEVLNRTKRYNPFFFIPLDIKEGAFEKQEQEKERDLEEKSFQLRKNVEYTNGLRWRVFVAVLSKTVKNLTETSLEILSRPKVPKALKELLNNPDKPKGFQRVQKGSKGFQRIPKGSKGFKRVPKDSKGFQRVP